MYRTEIVVNDISLLSGNEATKSGSYGGAPAADQKTRNDSAKGRQASRGGKQESEPEYDYDGLGITEGDLPPF